jgi:hypothetical protein
MRTIIDQKDSRDEVFNATSIELRQSEIDEVFDILGLHSEPNRTSPLPGDLEIYSPTVQPMRLGNVLTNVTG